MIVKDQIKGEEEVLTRNQDSEYGKYWLQRWRVENEKSC